MAQPDNQLCYFCGIPSVNSTVPCAMPMCEFRIHPSCSGTTSDDSAWCGSLAHIPFTLSGSTANLSASKPGKKRPKLQQAAAGKPEAKTPKSEPKVRVKPASKPLPPTVEDGEGLGNGDDDGDDEALPDDQGDDGGDRPAKKSRLVDHEALDLLAKNKGSSAAKSIGVTLTDTEPGEANLGSVVCTSLGGAGRVLKAWGFVENEIHGRNMLLRRKVKRNGLLFERIRFEFD